MQLMQQRLIIQEHKYITNMVDVQLLLFNYDMYYLQWFLFCALKKDHPNTKTNAYFYNNHMPKCTKKPPADYSFARNY